MIKITKDSPFYYPLTPQTVNHYFQTIFTPILNHQCVTVESAPRFGGLMRLIRFLVGNIDELSQNNHLPVNSQTFRFVIVNQEELVDCNAKTYLSLFYQKLAEIIPDAQPLNWSEITANDLVTLLKTKIEIITARWDLVIVLRGLGHLDFADKFFWGSLKAVRPPGIRDKVRYLFITYADAPEKLTDDKYLFIEDLLFQNIVKFDSVSPDDIDYLINRWGFTLNKTYTPSETSAIKTISQGNPILIKYACFCLENGCQPFSTPLEYLQNNHYIKNFFMSLPAPGLVIDPSRGDITFNGLSLLDRFSPGECDLLFHFAKNQGKLISKDDIANCIWAGEAETSFSDWAISQWIKRLRSKLKQIGANPGVIKTIRGRGYLFFSNLLRP
ncbi:winged helix-turn-helix domain-containing protein [Patescibacteria group bacterium]|nr:winged helix-turn-helix domain-containing protein [Patescibacteria group bacterium]